MLGRAFQFVKNLRAFTLDLFIYLPNYFKITVKGFLHFLQLLLAEIGKEVPDRKLLSFVAWFRRSSIHAVAES